MLNDIPKQFLCIDGIPILMRTINVFRNYNKNIRIIIVLPSDQQNQWNELCKKYNFNETHSIVSGGNTRFYSVKNGLNQINDDNCLIAVHDAVRPLVSIDVIGKAFSCAEKNGTAIPFIKINDSLRIIENDLSKPIDRNKIIAVQTPQCFNGKLLKKAYEQDFDESFTDDATVVECKGNKIFLVEGNLENIKITTPFDLLLAEKMLTSIKKN